MSCGIFIVGSLLLMAVGLSHGSPYYGNVYFRQGADAVSPNEQCRHRNVGVRTRACEVPDPAMRCEALMCSSGRGDIPSGEDTGPARDGTWCGPEKACFEGTCTGFSEFLVDPFDAERHENCAFDI